MCRHVLNAQVSIRFPDGNWYDCPECYLDVARAGNAHASADLERIGPVISFACHNCKNAFHKDMKIFADPDEKCPHCGNPYVIPAMTPEGCSFEEGQKFIADAFVQQLQTPIAFELLPDLVSDFVKPRVDGLPFSVFPGAVNDDVPEPTIKGTQRKRGLGKMMHDKNRPGSPGGRTASR